MINRRSFWLTLALVNLCIVAFLGFSLRSKILFPLPFLDYSRLLSAHSHFAFAGWTGLTLITLLIYDVLPEHFSKRKVYQWVLTLIEVSGLGMAFFFPFFGYNYLTIAFSTLYIIGIVVFVPVYIKDVLHTPANKNVKLLSISALTSLILSFSGTVGLMYIISTRSGGSLLYRDSIYTFLHFQYNGFFTLAAFALLINILAKKGIELSKSAGIFSILLCLSVVPSLFLALLWHSKTLFHLLAAIGCFFILTSLFYFFFFLRSISFQQIFTKRICRIFLVFSVVSFVLKMLLQVGTVFPQLGNAVYGDRPVIIGFLHLVFLGFITFFLLALLIDNDYFTIKNKIILLPFIVFSTGIIINELLLAVQGFGILLQTNDGIFKWLLWIASIILFFGSLLIALARLRVIRSLKK